MTKHDKWQFTEHCHCEAIFGTVSALDHVICDNPNNTETKSKSNNTIKS